jgi:hypothetical protein
LTFGQKKAYFDLLQNGKIRTDAAKINVRRDRVLADSFKQMETVEPAKWLKNFFMRFQNEHGIDEGGLTREWFCLLMKA